jgi:uncharacterized protein YbcI
MSSDGEVSPAGTADHGSVLAAVSNEMVSLFKSQFGRGPTQARANWAGDDILVVVLEHTLTAGERNLIDLGEHQRLRDSRTFLQYATVAEFCDPVERLTGRKVRGFLSATDSEVDGMTMETFVLHPPGYDGPSRSDAARRARHLT